MHLQMMMMMKRWNGMLRVYMQVQSVAVATLKGSDLDNILLPEK
jgi:hypothetical protein